jgi:predicted DNA-binding protein (UPF0251 family)
MGRQPLLRRVDFLPQITYFKPAGVPSLHLQEVRLSIEEAEAIRLKDTEGLEQDECAQRMRISRPTFARILQSARQKLADALFNGKAIRIEGGNYELAIRRFRCRNGHEWELPFEVMIEQPPDLCPTCNTAEIMALFPWRPGGGRRGGGGGRRRRHRGGLNW